MRGEIGCFRRREEEVETTLCQNLKKMRFRDFWEMRFLFIVYLKSLKTV